MYISYIIKLCIYIYARNFVVLAMLGRSSYGYKMLLESHVRHDGHGA
jgi:hypothetical protein